MICIGLALIVYDLKSYSKHGKAYETIEGIIKSSLEDSQQPL